MSRHLRQAKRRALRDDHPAASGRSSSLEPVEVREQDAPAGEGGDVDEHGRRSRSEVYDDINSVSGQFFAADRAREKAAPSDIDGIEPMSLDRPDLDARTRRLRGVVLAVVAVACLLVVPVIRGARSWIGPRSAPPAATR